MGPSAFITLPAVCVEIGGGNILPNFAVVSPRILIRAKNILPDFPSKFTTDVRVVNTRISYLHSNRTQYLR